MENERRMIMNYTRPKMEIAHFETIVTDDTTVISVASMDAQASFTTIVKNHAVYQAHKTRQLVGFTTN